MIENVVLIVFIFDFESMVALPISESSDDKPLNVSIEN